MRTRILQRQLDGTWTIRDLCRIFRKTPMTISLWRRHKGLPAVAVGSGSRPENRYVPDDIRRWARLTGVPMFERERRVRLKLENRMAA